MSVLREEIRKMVRLEPPAEGAAAVAGAGGGFRAVLTVEPHLMVLPDHFPGHPILPGMCMVQAVLLAGAAARGVRDLRLTLLKSAKYLRPVEPGHRVIIEGRMNHGPEGVLAIKAKLSLDGQAVADFSLEARPEGEAS
jgi:3-hydroxymyristoyl/3-hydroxydecanoyl-(acyl carrier protein) dehydratase